VILRFPTGLYANQIPQDPEDTGNVTYTISNEDPLTSGEEFILFPFAEKSRSRGARVYTNDERRAALGDLVYTIDMSSAPITGTSRKLFEVGQVLEFTDEEIADVAPNLVGRDLTLQHNTNLLDLNSLGLSDNEISKIESDSMALKEQLDEQLTALMNVIEDNETEIANLQKSINEANKAMAALLVLEDTESYQKVQQTRDQAMSNQQTLIATVNSQLGNSQVLRDKILAISQLVR
jgi:hypothetical protein